MTFQIDEEKLKSVKNDKSLFLRIFESIDNFIEKLGNLIKTVLIFLLVISVVIFIGGAILGILLFGWRQL